MDETWIHQYTPESNRQTAEWTAKGGKGLKRSETQISAGKVLASIFWVAHGISLINYLEKERITTRRKMDIEK